MNKAKVLIVDDDIRLRNTLKDILVHQNYEVYTASDGKQALKLAASRFFEVILMDFELSDKTGIEVVKDIRRFNLDSQIIMVTSHASMETAVKAIQESVYDFLVKPIDFDYLNRIIKKALEKLRLEQDVKKLLGELKSKNEELTNLNEMKSKFLSMASHDLSNTLMALQLSFEILISSLKADPSQQKKVTFIKSGMEQIYRLIHDLVDWAAIEKGKFNLNKKDFKVTQLLEEIVEGPKLRAETKQIVMSTVTKASNTTVYGDKKRITQVMLNLLENAVRHTPRGGKIDILVEPYSKDKLLLAVKDSGGGIESKDADKLFDSFYQIEGSHIKRGRLGLGLSIAKEIINAHGGKIWVESKGKNKGAVFQFTLPLSEHNC